MYRACLLCKPPGGLQYKGQTPGWFASNGELPVHGSTSVRRTSRFHTSLRGYCSRENIGPCLLLWVPAVQRAVQPASHSYVAEYPAFTDSREMASSCKGHLSTQELGGCVSLYIKLDRAFCAVRATRLDLRHHLTLF